ncbi:PadR family transcriptional regulator [Candidatus Enterococcus ferrettii]|uniref:Transcription regulator PadR N-terminal domain-containing protein n=1 Tax=Candidatus Enterococcus ferrettii TaxID=2815324 RepID=A0ABV0EVT8_9ENTE|nr:PadR family transcriptional regulator [Enterococcus sp. 665A]MBO1341398.1 PadR family transcriptional regulator [Enterococcus sp. 665A]
MTKLLVLAMLSMQPMSGYEIKSMLEMNDAKRWAGVLPGSIYNALKKLERDGYVEVVSLENSGHRQKAIYRITPKGEDYQQELALECLGSEKINYPTDLYTGISLAYEIPKTEAISRLKKNKKQLILESQAVKTGMNAKEKALQGDIPQLTKIVFEHMFNVIEAQIKLIDATISIIEKR